MLQMDDLLKVKFVKGGRDVSTGLDCYGLCQEVYRRIGKELPEYDTPDCRESIDSAINGMKGSFVKLEFCQPYALVLFTIRPPYESHIGVVLEDTTRFIHMLEGTGCSIERLSGHFWKNRIRGYYLWNPIS